MTYLNSLAASLGRPLTETHGHVPNIVENGSSLGHVLFIGDCMWEEEQLFPEFRKICELSVLNLRCALQEGRLAEESAVNAIREFAASGGREPDLIFFYARPSILSEEAFAAIRKRWKCPLLGMNLDDRVEFFPHHVLASGNDHYSRWSKHFDLNLTSSLIAVDWYRECGANVRYFPQGFMLDPALRKPPDSTRYDYCFSFVGSCKPEREILIEALAGYGIRPALFGNGWRNGVWLDNPAAVFRKSQINLGIGYALPSGQIANAKGRDIECPGVGACYLTTYHWEIANLFEIGKEVLCYRNFLELVEMYAYYSKRPDACLAIARAAYHRAANEHTWEARLRMLFRELGYRV